MHIFTMFGLREENFQCTCVGVRKENFQCTRVHVRKEIILCTSVREEYAVGVRVRKQNIVSVHIPDYNTPSFQRVILKMIILL